MKLQLVQNFKLGFETLGDPDPAEPHNIQSQRSAAYLQVQQLQDLPATTHRNTSLWETCITNAFEDPSFHDHTYLKSFKKRVGLCVKTERAVGLGRRKSSLLEFLCGIFPLVPLKSRGNQKPVPHQHSNVNCLDRHHPFGFIRPLKGLSTIVVFVKS